MNDRSTSLREGAAAREREEMHRLSMTPSVVTARKIMAKGDRLARLASDIYEETHDDVEEKGDMI